MNDRKGEILWTSRLIDISRTLTYHVNTPVVPFGATTRTNYSFTSPALHPEKAGVCIKKTGPKPRYSCPRGTLRFLDCRCGQPRETQQCLILPMLGRFPIPQK